MVNHNKHPHTLNMLKLLKLCCEVGDEEHEVTSSSWHSVYSHLIEYLIPSTVEDVV